MSKQLNILNFLKSNKRTTDNSTSSALSQHDLPQPLQTVPVVLDESNTTLDIEADSSSASKKFKSNDHETSTDAEIQPFSKNDIGLFVGKDHISATEIHDVLTNLWIPSDNYNFPQVLIHKKMRSICQHSWLSRYSCVIDEKKFYSIIIDATSDISGTEQLSLSIRYLSRDNNQIQIKEEFIGFTPLSDSSAKGIFEKIIEYLRSTGLDLTYLRGQGYDGCSVMSGHIGGVQKLISDTAPRALYVHCASHSLDLAICDACDDKIIQLFFGTIKTIIKFISGSPKRQNLFKKAIEATTCDIKRQKLAKLVDHRWVEKATSVLSFKQLFTSVMTLLEYLMENADAETGANARAYFKCIKDLDFIICLFVVSRIFAILKPYTEVLQSKNYDLAQCYDNIEEVAIYLAELKYDVTKFHELETELEHFAGENDITLTLPRTNKYENVNAYVKTIYETFIETTLTELGNRFSKHKKILVNVFNLLPSYVVEKEFNDVKQAFDFYKDDLPSNDMNVLAAEFEMW
ncbi:unnamed protein product [Rotaria sordida]|uniref:DUF4371 domain-containing protein n=1 Tax=Rotaria sordida TaxID=392033 RepID=A0A815L8X7_9BILA|nr:unnamed protein product [Rotaria sordida]